MDQSAQELVTLAREVARQAAEIARRMRSHGVGQVATKSTATDVVTAADKAVEREIIALLCAARPDDTVLGEEYGGDPGSAAAPVGSVRWIVDPIDGTVNYLYGLPHYAISIAAELDGEVVAGVVRNAATDAEWTATLGGGAWRDGRRLVCSTETDLGQALVGTGFGYDARRRQQQADVLAGLISRVRDIRRFGSAALDLTATAEGQLDAYFEKGLAAWDLAAGGLIAREAGLLVTGLRGRKAGPDMVLAAPAALHGPLHDRLAELDADGGF